jgi:hypothetical protein
MEEDGMMMKGKTTVENCEAGKYHQKRETPIG